MGQATAQMNVSDLRKVLGLPTSDLSPDSLELVSPGIQRYRVRRQSMEQLDLFKVWYATSAWHAGSCGVLTANFHRKLVALESSCMLYCAPGCCMLSCL
jgi:hypothetical protein